MGQGAHVTINNKTEGLYTVSYPSDTINCLYQDGEDGSDLSTITGPIAAGATLPATGGHQYIEAISSGKCKFETTTLGMLFVDAFENSQVVALSESGWTWECSQRSIQIGSNWINVQITNAGRGGIDTIVVTLSTQQF